MTRRASIVTNPDRAFLPLPWGTDGHSRRLPLDPTRFRPHPIIHNGRLRMNLPDAPIAHEGFFATHFFTVRNQEKSKDFYVRVLGGKVIKPENPCYIKLANTWIILNSGGGPTPAFAPKSRIGDVWSAHSSPIR